jgi:hypothetical protein
MRNCEVRQFSLGSSEGLGAKKAGRYFGRRNRTTPARETVTNSRRAEVSYTSARAMAAPQIPLWLNRWVHRTRRGRQTIEKKGEKGGQTSPFIQTWFQEKTAAFDRREALLGPQTS